jgi:integrase
MSRVRDTGLVFEGRAKGRPISPKHLLSLTPPGVTIHGFRLTFRDWCGNETTFARETAEQALAHATGNMVEQAYRRSDALEKRRRLMEAWAAYCEPRAPSNVVSIGARKI